MKLYKIKIKIKMSAKQSKPIKSRNPFSFLFQKAPKKPINSIQLQTSETNSIKIKSKMTEDEFELLNKYYSTESIVTSLSSLENIIEFKNNHIRRLSHEKSCISDMNAMIIKLPLYNENMVTNEDSVLLGVLNRWTKQIKNSAENLEETLEVFYAEQLEPVACFHLNRSIVHLVNLYETICELSKIPPKDYDINMYGYLHIVAKCITDFRLDFTKYCVEINNYLADFKKTLTLLINRHPENGLVIHAMGDIEKLYNFSTEMINKITTGTPVELEASMKYIDIISNDINDIKSDLINVKHHQDKDKKYVTSSYV